MKQPVCTQADLVRLLHLLGTTLEQGRLPQPVGDEAVQLFVTSLVGSLLDPDAGKADRKRPDHASELQPALASGCALTGVLAEPSLLFINTSSGRELCQKLLTERRVLAVVELPPRLLHKTGIGLCLLLLVPSGTAETVTLLDARAEYAGFSAPGPTRGQRVLADVERLAATLAQGTGGWWVTRLPADAPALLEGLQPSRHALDPQQRQIADYFAERGAFSLGDVLDSIPPVSRFDDGNGVPVRVVGPADLPHPGLVLQAASGERFLDEAVVLRRPGLFLQAGDLLLSVSRSQGLRIAVVPPNVPPAGAGGWVAARAVWAFRPRAGSAYDARALAVMLTSPLGEHLLHAMLLGREHVVPRLLLGLHLPAMDEAGIGSAIALVEQHAQYQQDIRDLARRQAELRHQLWPLPANTQENRNTP